MKTTLKPCSGLQLKQVHFELAGAKNQIAELGKALSQTRAELKKVKECVAESVEPAVHLEAAEKLAAERAELAEQLKSLQAENEGLRGRAAAAEDEMAALRAIMEEESRRGKAQAEELAELSQQNVDLQAASAETKALRDQLDAVKARVAELSEQNAELSRESERSTSVAGGQNRWFPQLLDRSNNY